MMNPSNGPNPVGATRLVFHFVLSCLFCNHMFAAGQGDSSPILSNAFANFTDCNPDFYYSALSEGLGKDPTSWSRSDITDLLRDTHRNSVPTESIFNALVKLDKGVSPGRETVQLLYSNKVVSAYNYGDIDSWTYEALWPVERGAAGAPAFTDVHNLRAEYTRVTFMRSDLFFGKCATVEYGDVCKIPATFQTADDTAQDGKVWLPPANVRGDIARALFYMDLRYSDDALNLTLTDCPPFDTNMGYLSQLLEWHIEDPVDDVERQRNEMACGSYQGNRNIFVDYPQLAEHIFGKPEKIAPSTRTYPKCLDIPTQMPTPSPNECSAVQPGDIMMYVVESDDPDNIGFITMAKLPAGLEIYMTDNAWTGNNFLSNEGVQRFEVPPGGLYAGQRFGYGNIYAKNYTRFWSPEEGIFNLGITGDTLILYCLLNDDSPKPILAFSSSGPWLEPGLSPEDYGTEFSALPETCINASIALEHHDNYEYNGRDSGTRSELMADMLNPEMWQGFDRSNYDGRGAAAATIPLKISILLTSILSAIFVMLLQN